MSTTESDVKSAYVGNETEQFQRDPNIVDHPLRRACCGRDLTWSNNDMNMYTAQESKTDRRESDTSGSNAPCTHTDPIISGRAVFILSELRMDDQVQLSTSIYFIISVALRSLAYNE